MKIMYSSSLHIPVQFFNYVFFASLALYSGLLYENSMNLCIKARQ